MRSPAAEAVVDPSFAVAAAVAAIGLAEVPIVVVEVADVAAGAGSVADTVVEDIESPNTATASTVAAGCSPAAAVAGSLAVAAGLGSLVGAVTDLPGVGPEAPSPWPCPLRRACQK